jgi:S-adenosyl methyltransferase
VTRAVTWLARSGVDQFLDLGSGLPTIDNVHEAARRVNPDAQVVYVDNDGPTDGPVIDFRLLGRVVVGRGRRG